MSAAIIIYREYAAAFREWGVILSDTEIIDLIKNQPVKGRRALFDQFCDYVYVIAAGKIKSCGSREDIEECVSDIFADVYKYVDSKEVEGSLKALVSTIAKRRSIDFFRRLSGGFGKTVSIESDEMYDIPSNENISESAENKERNRIILNKIKELGEPDSTIIIQQYFYNRTAREIADSVSLTASNVQRRSSRARDKLRKLLIEAGITY